AVASAVSQLTVIRSGLRLGAPASATSWPAAWVPNSCALVPTKRPGRVGAAALDQVGIVEEALRAVARQLVAADVVQRLLLGAVLVDLPREELVESVAVD